MKWRRRERGFVVFAALFWLVIACFFVIFSFGTPRLNKKGCIVRFFFGVAGVLGFFVGALMLSALTPLIPTGYHMMAFWYLAITGAISGMKYYVDFVEYVSEAYR